MLKIMVPTNDVFFDPDTDMFMKREIPIFFEHTLETVSRWEEKYQKPFFSQDLVPDDKKITEEEMLDYIHSFMFIRGQDPVLLKGLSLDGGKRYEEIQEYLGDTHSATWFKNDPNAKNSKEIVTSEVIYYWMFSLGIPIETEKWNLNRLLTLIRIFASKQEKPKKMSRRELANRNAMLNAQRKAKFRTRG